MIFDWNSTTTNMLLGNIKDIVSNSMPIITILMGIFVGFWILEIIIGAIQLRIRNKSDLIQEQVDELENHIINE